MNRKNAVLQQAIKEAGGPTAFARLVGVSRQLVLYWQANRVPAERLIQVERTTGISRRKFRPDLYGTNMTAKSPTSEIFALKRSF